MKDARRGEVWLVDLGYAAKTRPALVVSTPYGDGERALLAGVPHTTSTHGGRFEVAVATRYLEVGSFDVQALGQMKPTNLIRRLGGLPPQDLGRIEAVIKRWLELT